MNTNVETVDTIRILPKVIQNSSNSKLVYIGNQATFGHNRSKQLGNYRGCTLSAGRSQS